VEASVWQSLKPNPGTPAAKLHELEKAVSSGHRANYRSDRWRSTKSTGIERCVECLLGAEKPGALFERVVPGSSLATSEPGLRTLVERLSGLKLGIRAAQCISGTTGAVQDTDGQCFRRRRQIRSAMGSIHQGPDQTRLGDGDEQESVSKSLPRQVNEIRQPANASLDELTKLVATW